MFRFGQIKLKVKIWPYGMLTVLEKFIVSHLKSRNLTSNKFTTKLQQANLFLTPQHQGNAVSTTNITNKACIVYCLLNKEKRMLHFHYFKIC